MSDSPASSAANRPDAIAVVLRENLAELNSLLATVATEELDTRSAPDEWSVREILLHVIHAERWTQPQLLELRRAVDPDGETPAIGGVTLPDTEANADLNELRWSLTNALRHGNTNLDQPGLAEHLRQTVVNQIAIDQPKYSGFKAATV